MEEKAVGKSAFMQKLHADAKQEDTFTVSLFNGDIITFRLANSSSEVEALEKQARRLVRVATNNPPESWKPFLPLDESTARQVIYVSALSVEPKLSQRDCLEMAKTPYLVPVMLVFFNAVMEKISMAVATTETEAWTDAGEDSAEML